MDALIFDFDGTIIETEGPDFQAWQEIFADYGGDLTTTLWVQYIGTAAGTFDPYRLLEEQIGRRVNRDAIRAVRRQRFRDLVSAQPLRPGVEALMAAADAARTPLAIASSSTRDWVEWNLDQRDLRRRFQHVYTFSDVSRGKPDPELYLTTLAALGVDAAKAVALEDSYNGMLAAKAAGLACVVAPNARLAGVDFAEADLVVGSLAEVTFTQLGNLCQ
ncbi:MAG: HAD-IA family hydrolase [Caldilineaceae bacterium]